MEDAAAAAAAKGGGGGATAAGGVSHRRSLSRSTFMSSNGLRLRQKVVEFYESVFERGADPSACSFDFLLLTANELELQRAVRAMGAPRFRERRDALRYLFAHCLEHVDSREPVRTNALTTLRALFSAVFERLPAGYGDLATMLHDIWGIDKAGAYFRDLLTRLRAVLLPDDAAPAAAAAAAAPLAADDAASSCSGVSASTVTAAASEGARDAALRVLLAAAAVTKVHQNVFFEYFRMHDTFPVLLGLVVAAGEDGADGGGAGRVRVSRPILLKAAALAALQAHYKKYDSRNPQLDELARSMSPEQISGLDGALAVLLGYARALDEAASSRSVVGSASPANLIGYIYDTTAYYVALPVSAAMHIAGAAAGAAAAAVGIAGAPGGAAAASAVAAASGAPAGHAASPYPGTPAAARRLPVAGGAEDAGEAEHALRLQSQAARAAGLYLFYLLVANNSKFVVRTARLRREAAAAGAGGGGGPRGRGRAAAAHVVVPTECPASVAAFLSAATRAFTEKMHNRPRGVVAARMCLVIMRVMSEDAACNILLHDMSLQARVDMCRRVAVGVSGPSAASERVWTQSDPDLPLVASVYEALADFMASHAHLVPTLSAVHLGCYGMAMDVVYRHMCYQLGAAAAGGSAPGPVAVALSPRYLRVARVLMRVCASAAQVKGASGWARVRGVVRQAAHTLRLVLSLRETLLAAPSDATLLLYEMARSSSKLTALLSLARRRDGADVAAEMGPLCEVAQSLAARVDSLTSSRASASPLSSADVLAVVDAAKDTLRVHATRPSGGYAKYVENQGHAHGEAAFFDMYTNDVLVDVRHLYLDASSPTFHAARRQEAALLVREQHRARPEDEAAAASSEPVPEERVMPEPLVVREERAAAEAPPPPASSPSAVMTAADLGITLNVDGRTYRPGPG